MKKLNLINKIAVAFAMLGLLMCVNIQSAYGQSGVGINTTDAAANANAMLDVQSTTKGVLLTPMTAAQANTAFGSSLSVAAQGLTVYITSGSAGPFTSSGYWYNTSATTTPVWVSIGNGSVTLVATGYGLTGGPIASSGTLSADTTAYATSTNSGFLKYSDWTTFNAKQNALAIGDLTDAGTDGITVTNGTGSVIGSGTSIAQQKADGSHNGYLSSGDWTTFNGKGSGNGSVTSVSAGYGTNFSTISTTGSIVADTSILINKTGTQTLTNKTISGSSNTVTNIGNSSLTNSSITVSPGVDLTGGGAISLGSSVTLNADTTQYATSTHSGFLKYSDWTTFNGKGSGNGSVTSVSAGYGTNFSTISTTGSIVADTSILINKTGTQTLTNKTISGSNNTVTNIGNSSLANSSVTVSPGVDLTGGGSVSLGSSVTLNADTTQYATSTNSGFLKYADWTTFNAKQNALATGNLTDAGTDGITVTNGTGSVIGSGASIAQQKADGSHNGYLSSGDWTTFNGKGSGNGSVTSVSAGYGTNFSTFTTTGSIVADTSILINKTGTQTLTNKTISGSSNTVTNIGNSSLTNSSITVSPGVDLTGGGAISLGSSVTLNADTTQYATSTHSGFLKYADWTTFNSKQNALSLGTGVATALGLAVTGSGGIALATSPTFTTPVLGAATATSVNGLTLTANSVGFAIAGGTTSKTLTVSNNLTLAGNDGSTLNIGGGGTLGSNAFTSTAYAPLASPTFTGTVTIPSPFTLGSTSVTSTGTQLNYLNAATGTTGTTSSNLVFSASPTFTGTVTDNTGAVGTKGIIVNTPSSPTADLQEWQINGTTDASINSSGQIVSSLSTGTAPFVVSSATQVANLNASQLVGATWASPAAIGSTTPAAGSFAGLTMSDATNIALGTTTGTKIGTATTQKLGFYNASPVAQQTGDLITGLSNLGLITSGSISTSDVTGLSTTYAPLASPTFTGTPAAPTATAGTSTTQIATTAFVANNFAATGTLIARKIIASGTTVTIDGGTNAILVELIGGGGGGAGANGAGSSTDCGSGGGSGAYTSYYLASPATSYGCTIGGAGSAGASTGANGGGGGSTSIVVGASTISALGGSGGSHTGQSGNALSSAGGAGGGVGSGGTFMVGGTPGQIGLVTGNNSGNGGNGGSSVYGAGGVGPVASSNVKNGSATPATGYGGGGAGGAAATSGNGATGGAGTAGCIIVWEYR